MKLVDYGLLTANILPVNKPTVTGRIYTRDVCEHFVEQISDNKVLPLTLNFPEFGKIDVNSIAAFCNDAQIVDDNIEVTARLVDTPSGFILRALIRENVNMFYTVSCVGMVDVDTKLVKKAELLAVCAMSPDEK